MESAEIERELEELESRVERLRALYEQYFMGLEKIEPQIPRKDVDRRIWMLRREQIRNTGMRFKFQMVIQRYNTFQQYWGRVTREIESGTYRRDVMRAAVRVGAKEALTLVGKKRAKQYAVLLEAQSARRRPKGAPGQPEAPVEDEEVALTDDDIEPASQHGRAWGDIADVMDDGDDDARTPAPAAARPRVPAPSDSGFEIDIAGDVAAAFGAAPEGAASPKGSPGGPGWGGSPRVARTAPFAPTPAASLRADIVERAVDHPAVEPVAPVPARPAQASVVRGGSYRVAELAAAMRSRPEEARTSAPSSLGLDLDLDDDHPLPPKPAPASVRPSSPGSPAARVLPFGAGGVARPNAAARPRRRSSRAMQAVRPPAESPAAPPAAAAPPPAVAAAPAPTPAAAAPPAAATAAARPDAEAAAARTPQPRPERAEPPPPKPAKPDLLSEQRIRQIYSKYVETKRSSNESTAGMTYERLAESLRSQASRLKTSHPTKSVDYEVVVKDGKTLLKPILR